MAGVHVLVTTVPCLLRLTVGLGFTGLSRCCHLVFDDADATFEAFSQEVSAVMAMHARAHQENAEMLNQVGCFTKDVQRSLLHILIPYILGDCHVKRLDGACAPIRPCIHEEGGRVGVLRRHIQVCLFIINLFYGYV